jgi:aerobic-type carbon monoxide dehydrogenase small subunit (CoxS/CutS family)
MDTHKTMEEKEMNGHQNCVDGKGLYIKRHTRLKIMQGVFIKHFVSQCGMNS